MSKAKMTRAEDFFNKFPKAEVDEDCDIPATCAAYIYGKENVSCGEDKSCEDCWNEYVDITDNTINTVKDQDSKNGVSFCEFGSLASGDIFRYEGCYYQKIIMFQCAPPRAIINAVNIENDVNAENIESGECRYFPPDTKVTKIIGRSSFLTSQ